MNYNPTTYWNNIFKQGVNAQSVCYPEWPLSYNHFLHLQQLKTFEEIINTQDIELKNKSILEIGPGAGFWTSYFNHHNPAHYLGIDISKSVVDTLHENFPTLRFAQADIGVTSLEEILPQKVDLIFAAMVFLHITDNEKLAFAFKQFDNMLLPGGRIIFLDAIYTKHVFGNTIKQTDGKEFDSSFHNKIRPISFFQKIAQENNLTIQRIIPAFNSSQFCFDFNTKFGYFIWGKLYYAIHRRILKHANEKLGTFYAKFQSALDSFLTNTCKQSMSSKWIIINKQV